MGIYHPEKFKLNDSDFLIIRHCEAQDADKFPEFQQKIAHESTNTLQVKGHTPPVEKVRENWLMCTQKKHYLRIGAFHKERLVAQLSLSPMQNDHPWTNHIASFNMMVLKDFWGLGIGKKLLKIMEDYALNCGYSRIEALVRTYNERGLNLYLKNGYTLEGTRHNCAFIDGTYQSEYYIAKALTELEGHKDWRPPQLETKRLHLRALNESDAHSIFEYAKNPNVSKYTLWEPHESLTDSIDFIVEYAHSEYRKGVPEPFGITLKNKPDKVIGTVGCFWVSKSSKSMELAYAIAEPYWGQGLVAEASKAVVDYCFKNFDLQRIQCRCKTENKASTRVMEKLGMSFEGTLRDSVYHRNRFWDMHHYSLLRDQWQSQELE